MSTMAKSRLQEISIGEDYVVLPARFWSKVNFTETCWLWTGANSGGPRPYGVSWDGERRIKAHRWSLEAVVGEIPNGFEADHLCLTPLCVRPSHMQVVTKAENVLRSNAPGPKAVRTNRCKWGHEFTPENTIQRGPRHRECATCRAAHSLKSRQRRTKMRRAIREAAQA